MDMYAELCAVSRGGNGRLNGTPFQPNIYILFAGKREYTLYLRNAIRQCGVY